MSAEFVTGHNPYYNDNSDKIDLITAASVGDLKLVEAILAGSNINPNMVNSSGWTPLMYAAHYGHFNVVRTLIQHGCVVDYKEQSQGRTALMLAASNGHTRCIEMLLKVGRANKEEQDLTGNNAAYYASHYGHGNNKMIKLLLGSEDLTNQRLKPYSITRASTPKVTVSSPGITETPKFKNHNPHQTKALSQEKNSYSVFSNNLSPFGSHLDTIWAPPKKNLDLKEANKELHTLIVSTTLPPQNSPAYSSSPRFDYTPEDASSNSPHPSYSVRRRSFVGKTNSPPLPNTLSQFLTRIGLDNYLSLFQENGIDLYTFLTLNDNDFEKLGIQTYGHRKRLAIAQMRFHESVEIRNVPERLFADWLLNERETLLKKIEKLEEKLNSYQNN